MLISYLENLGIDLKTMPYVLKTGRRVTGRNRNGKIEFRKN